MTPGKPREPANRERLRDLMRGVMVRNTRALAALRLPRRHASTMRVDAGRRRGGLLSRAVGAGRATAGEPAGSTGWRCSICWPRRARRRRPPPRRCARFVERHAEDARLGRAARPLSRRSRAGAKEAALLDAAARRIPARRRWCSCTIAIRWRISRICCAGRAPRSPGSTAACPARPRTQRSPPSATEVPVLLCSEFGRRGPQPAILQYADQLRYPVEPDGDRAAHRPHRPDRPDARGVRVQPGDRGHDRGRGAAHPR